MTRMVVKVYIERVDVEFVGLLASIPLVTILRLVLALVGHHG